MKISRGKANSGEKEEKQVEVKTNLGLMNLSVCGRLSCKHHNDAGSPNMRKVMKK